MNWFNTITISFLLCIYPTFEFYQTDKLAAAAETTAEYLDSTQIDSATNMKFTFAATKPFKLKKSKEIL